MQSQKTSALSAISAVKPWTGRRRLTAEGTAHAEQKNNPLRSLRSLRLNVDSNDDV